MSLRRKIRKPRERRTVTDWVDVDCPGCGAKVLFLPAQAVNVCAFCDARVARVVG